MSQSLETNYIILPSETKNPLKGSDFIVIFEPLSHDLPSLQGRALRNSPAGYFSEGASLQRWQGKGVSMYETKENPGRKDVYKD